MCNARWIDEFAGSDKHAPRVLDLGDAVGGQLELGDAGVAAVFGPFGFSCC